MHDNKVQHSINRARPLCPSLSDLENLHLVPSALHHHVALSSSNLPSHYRCCSDSLFVVSPCPCSRDDYLPTFPILNPSPSLILSLNPSQTMTTMTTRKSWRMKRIVLIFGLSIYLV